FPYTTLFRSRMASSVEVQQVTGQELYAETGQPGVTNLPPGVLAYAVQGPFFFGAVENFERALAGTHTDPRVLILQLRRVPFVDITALQVLEEVTQELRKRGVVVMLSGANARVRTQLERAGIIDLVGTEHVYDLFSQAVASAAILAQPEPEETSTDGDDDTPDIAEDGGGEQDGRV